MKLKEYLKKNNINYRTLAKQLDVHYQSVFRLANESTPPSLKLAKKIENLTKGEVSIMDLMPPYAPRKKCPCCGKVMKRGAVIENGKVV